MKPELASLPADSAARRQALAVDRSLIVQAPAGSGKTELLIQRILALLAVVDAPEEILAITFTRKAAAEMRKRLLEALARAADEAAPTAAHALETWQRARQALERDRERGWNLPEHPARLQVLTIDSLCAALVRRMPYLSRFGEMPAIAEDPAELYREAAERLCARLEGDGQEASALQQLLGHLDNRLPLLRDLLVGMLGRRDQWLRHLRSGSRATARGALEQALSGYVTQRLDEAAQALGPSRLAELAVIGRWAAANLAGTAEEDNPLAALLDGALPPGSGTQALPVWQGLLHLLLTSQDQLRSPRGLTVKVGFPPGKTAPGPEMKERMATLLDSVAHDPVCLERLLALRKLPECVYADAQWATLAALIELLPLAVAELRGIFRQRGRVDFAEIAGGALAALGDEMAPTELLLQLDGRLRHILVDEFQDTSRAQYDLLATLTAGWERGDGRTLFLVGDPMQSIYRFREAEVGLYLHARSHGIGAIPLEPLLLTANFRSRANLVAWCNRLFARLFPAAEDAVRGAVPFAPAQAIHPALPEATVTGTCFVPRDDAAEAAQVVELVLRAQAEQADGTIAVLVRARSHLTAIVPALKAAGLRFQAQEIDALSDRPATQDLLSLCRALLHPADRVAWLAVLRAPWCGLTLADLMALVDDRPDATVPECLLAAVAPRELFTGLSDDGLQRLARVTPVLLDALFRKGRLPLRRLVESTWLSLGGPAGLSESDLLDAGQFLALLDELDAGGDLPRLEILEERLARLFAAPDALAGPQLQLMTIHKAKGLEFDTVILPGLGRGVGASGQSLLLWQEDPEHGLLLAPIPPSGSDQPEPTFRALAAIHCDKDRLETLRLFYVAATRAKRALHLLGQTNADPDGRPQSPAVGSLLQAAWEVLAEEMEFPPAANAVAKVAAPRPGLWRLPAGWVPPSLAEALPVALPVARRASVSAAQPLARLSLGLRSEEGRIVGTLVHLWLERMAADGPAGWDRERVEALRPILTASLGREGVPGERLEACRQRVLAALHTTLASARGRWILAAHPGAASELALTGVFDAQPLHAVIDRTFVADGVRWVIDYKTSEPFPEEPLAAFLARETEHYRPQLQVYLELLARAFPDERLMRGALYFPLLDAWQEVE